MNKFQTLIEAGQLKITNGEEHLWDCYGSNARYIELSSTVSNLDENDTTDIELEIIFDNTSQEVYQACLYVGEHIFRWINPDFEKKYREECYSREIDPRLVYDNTFYTDCEIFEDFLQKTQDSFVKGSCDTSILISVFLTDDNVNLLKNLGEDLDLEKFIVDSLRDKIKLICDDYNKIWNKISKELSNNGISFFINKEMIPVSDKNIDGIISWIKSLNLTDVYMEYHDKETANGIESFLSIESSNAKQKSVYSYICHN